MMLDVGQDIYFVDCAFLQFFVLAEFVNGYDFDGVFSLVVVVERAIDFAVHSRTDRFV